MAVTDPLPLWPIEPTVLYVVTYYPTNAVGENPTGVNLTMTDYNSAIEAAKTLITNAGNVGICTIQQTCCNIVYPSIPWQDF